MALIHTQCSCADDEPSVFVLGEDGRVRCDHCNRALLLDIDLPLVCEAVPSGDRYFDRVASLVQRAVKVPTAFVTLVDQVHQVFLGSAGQQAQDYTGDTPLSSSFCQYVVMAASPLVVDDVANEPLIATELGRTTMPIGAYAGFPIMSLDNVTVGSLCAVDERPHHWSEEEIGILTDFAVIISSEISKRHALHTVQESIFPVLPGVPS